MKDGGPAFPTLTRLLAGEGHIGGSNDFDAEVSGGMTLRQWYAGMALQGMMSNPDFSKDTYKDSATQAFEMADAMLAYLERGEEGVSQ